jgi:hypothetical protein
MLVEKITNASKITVTSIQSLIQDKMFLDKILSLRVDGEIFGYTV